MPRKHISFLIFNAEGLQSKLEDPILHRDIYKYDIIVLLQTWLPQGFQVKFPGFYSYSIYRPKNPKAKRCSGGITILVKDLLRKGIKILPCSSNFFVWFKLDKGFFNTSRDIFVCVSYIPPRVQAFISIRINSHFKF